MSLHVLRRGGTVTRMAGGDGGKLGVMGGLGMRGAGGVVVPRLEMEGGGGGWEGER